MTLSDISIKNPVFAWMLMTGLMVFGLIGFHRMGISQLPDVIKSEVLKFSATTTNAISVAGQPAKHFIGRGIEADDNDPATADIVVFAAGPNVFAACVHGEGNQAGEERAPMLAVLKTAKAP